MRLNRALVLEAARAGLAAALCTLIYLHFNLPYGYWTVIAAVLILQGSVGASVRAAISRILSTVVGASVGALFGYAGPPTVITMAACVFFSILICNCVPSMRGNRLAALTAVIVLVQAGSYPATVAVDRLLENTLGIIVAMLVIIMFSSMHASKRLSASRLTLLTACAELFDVLYRQASGEEVSAEPVEQLREEALRQLQADRAVLADAALEPGASITPESHMRAILGRLYRHLAGLATTMEAAPDTAVIDRLRSQFDGLADAIRSALRHNADLQQAEALRQAAAELQAALQRLRDSGLKESTLESVLHAYHLFGQLRLLAGELEELSALQTADPPRLALSID